MSLVKNDRGQRPAIGLVGTMHELAVQGGWGAPLLRKHGG